ncbi:BMP family ABC transporter substrate-binding protein [Salinispira pacifica]
MSQKARLHVLRMFLLAALIAALFGCSGGRSTASSAPPYRIALFLPGVAEGNPTFELLVAGAHRAVKRHPNAAVSVIEGGYDETAWSQKLSQLAASGTYDLLVSSGYTAAALCADLSRTAAAQKFLLFNAYLPDNPSIASFLFNRREEGFLAGYFAGLLTGASSSGLEHLNANLAAGLIVGQHDEVTDAIVSRAYELGLKSVNPAITMDYQAVGNWFDSAKAAELARGMIGRGVDVILTVSGAGNAGVITAAKEAGAYLVWWDGPGYKQAPGTVLGSVTAAEDRAAYEKISSAIEGKLEFGSAAVLDAKGGYITFDQEGAAFRKDVPERIRNAVAHMMGRLTSGEFRLDMPTEAPPAAAAEEKPQNQQPATGG